jgi:hypothetical protein
MVDEPSVLATLPILERHLDRMRKLPDEVSNKRDLVDAAEKTLRYRRALGRLPGDPD